MPLQVRDIMTPDPEFVHPDTPLSEVARLLMDRNYSGLPVCDEDRRPIGVVEVDDLLPRPANVPATDVPVLDFQGEWVAEHDTEEFMEGLRRNAVEGIMREEFARIDRDDSVGQALEELVTRDHRRLLIVDETSDELIGVITRTDILRLLIGGV